MKRTRPRGTRPSKSPQPARKCGIWRIVYGIFWGSLDAPDWQPQRVKEHRLGGCREATAALPP
eukprot:3499627-Alexandrium_andersonii.AAC.1